MFRPQDESGWCNRHWAEPGRNSLSPAWDFQWFIPDIKVGEAYGFVMRACSSRTKRRSS